MQRPVQARVQAKKGRGCGGVESSIFIVILKSSLSTFFHIGLHFKLNDIYTLGYMHPFSFAACDCAFVLLVLSMLPCCYCVHIAVVLLTYVYFLHITFKLVPEKR